MDGMVAIQASTYQQACLAAEMLDLPKPDGYPGAHVRYVDRPDRARGIRFDRVIFVEPRLTTMVVDWVRQSDTRTRLRLQAEMRGVEIETVTT
jgi:hypothetical protein